MANAADRYRDALLQTILRVDGIRPVDGFTALQVRKAADALVREYGVQQARLGLMGLAAQNLDRATAQFVQTVVSYLWDMPAIPAGPQAGTVAAQVKSAFASYQQTLYGSAYASMNGVIAQVLMSTQESLDEGLLSAGMTFRVNIFDGGHEDVIRRMNAARPAVRPIDVMIADAFAGTDIAVDKWIRAMEGVPAREATARLFADLIGVQNMPGAQSLGHRGEQIRRRVQSIGSYRERFMTGYRIPSSARRIVMSEMQAAKQHSMAYSAAKSPASKYVQWRLSSRHPIIASSPDICDVYAYGDWHGGGKGLFRPENVPGHPHPFCACTLVPMVIEDTEKWGNFGAPPKPRMPSYAEVSGILRRAPGPATLTQRRIVTTTRNAAGELTYANYRFNRMGV